jgi:putative phosphoribosyl transferase
MIFANREEAGQMLARQLMEYAGRSDVVVLGIPRGGVPVGFEIAHALGAPLDIFVARKLGVPGEEELAFGAIASGGVRILDLEVIKPLRISTFDIESVTIRELKELQRREKLYRGNRAPLEVRGRVVILVDDGVATGSSIRAAISALRHLQPAKLVVAAPVAPLETARELTTEADDFVCVETPGTFGAIGQFYDDFSQVTDGEVTDLLRRSWHEPITRPIET